MNKVIDDFFISRTLRQIKQRKNDDA